MQKIIVLLSILANITIFLVLHCRKHKDKASLAHKEESRTILSKYPTWTTIKTRLFQCIPTGHNIVKYSQNSVRKYGADYITLAVFLCLNYMLPYFMWPRGEMYRCNVLTATRLLGAIMSCLLLLKNNWPTRLCSYFPTYWHTTVMYVLPFSTTLSFLIMGGTTEWLINVALTIIMLNAVVDWLSFIILAVIGTSLGIGFYRLRCFFSIPEDPTSLPLDLVTVHHLTYTCIFSTVIGLLFFERRKEEDKRLATLELFGNIIGKEIQNILALSKAYARSIQHFKAQMRLEKKLPTENNDELLLIKMGSSVYTSFKETVDNLMHDSEQSVQIINKILATLQENINTDDFTRLSMKSCVTNTLELYNFTKHFQNNLFVKLDEDFQFYGSAYYMQYLLLNLLENAYIHSRQDNKIEIWIKKHRLYVRDNGTGIAKEALPYIFDPFFTTTKATMGVGLAFCKRVMDAFGGTIICKSKQGKGSFTEFVLTFPRLKQ